MLGLHASRRERHAESPLFIRGEVDGQLAFGRFRILATAMPRSRRTFIGARHGHSPSLPTAMTRSSISAEPIAMGHHFLLFGTSVLAMELLMPANFEADYAARFRPASMTR